MNDPVYGKSWTLNEDESTFAPGEAPSDETRLYEQAGDGYKLTVRGTRKGHSYEWGYTVGTDGIPCPVYGRADVDMIEKHRVSDCITIGSFTKDGEIVASYRRETSPDGSSLTVVAAGNSNLDGTTYFDVMRYDPAGS
jgi:hypothetical protein